MFHTPTGISESRQGRKRESNYKEAKAALLAKLAAMESSSHASSVNSIVKDQIGSGMRGDKIRTYRFQDDKVTDHCSDKSLRLKTVMKGNMDKFFC